MTLINDSDSITMACVIVSATPPLGCGGACHDCRQQAESAVRERTGSVLSPERLTALAVAVASAEDPLATLEKLCVSVLDGVDVGVVLKELLDDRKGKGDDKENSG